MTIHELPTPCLLLDLDLLESNIRRMSQHARDYAIALRPHAKTHKCVEIARRQLQAGAVGISVATMAEAEILSRHGISGLLITGAAVDHQKIRRLIEVLRRLPDTMIVTDHLVNVGDLNEAAAAAGVQIPVLVDLDVGQKRTGVSPGQPALQMAEHIAQSPNLVLKGISAYAGHIAHIAGFEARRAASIACMSKAVETRDLLGEHGHRVEIVTGGSTGTYNIDPDVDGVTELQSGSYVFMDVDYRKIGGKDGPVYDDFHVALTVLSTVVHRSQERAVVDAGLKAFATDRPFGPEPLDLGGVTYQFAGDEHGRLSLENPARELRLGDRIRWVVPHCDPTVNLYDRLFCVRGEAVEAAWSIMDRAAASGYF